MSARKASTWVMPGWALRKRANSPPLFARRAMSPPSASDWAARYSSAARAASSPTWLGGRLAEAPFHAPGACEPIGDDKPKCEAVAEPACQGRPWDRTDPHGKAPFQDDHPAHRLQRLQEPGVAGKRRAERPHERIIAAEIVPAAEHHLPGHEEPIVDRRGGEDVGGPGPGKALDEAEVPFEQAAGEQPDGKGNRHLAHRRRHARTDQAHHHAARSMLRRIP